MFALWSSSRIDAHYVNPFISRIFNNIIGLGIFIINPAPSPNKDYFFNMRYIVPTYFIVFEYVVIKLVSDVSDKRL